MKRISILLALVCALFAFSCKKEAGADTKQTKVYNILQIHLNDVYKQKGASMAVNAAPMNIPVELSATTIGGGEPPVVSMLNDVVVSVDPEGVVECSIDAEGLVLEPKTVGEATLTLSPKTLLGESVSFKVTVTEKAPEPVKVEIITTDSHFTGKTLKMLEGNSFTFSAVVTSDFGSALPATVKWSVVEGASYVSIDADSGKLTTKTLGTGVASATAKVRVTVDGHTDLTDEVTVVIQPLVKSVSISTSNFLNADNDLITKKGDIRKFRYSVQPTGAYDDIEVVLYKGAKVSASRDGSDIVLTMSNTSSPSSTTVTLRSQKNPSASLSFNVFIFDYDAYDIKVGDYVYCADGSFITTDCGLRYVGSNTNIYVDANGRRTNVPMGILSYWSSFYIGVIASTQTPTLGSSVLKDCKNPSCDGNLYQYRSFYASDLPGLGFDSTHCLVVRKNYSSSTTTWQNQGEMVSFTQAKKDGIYQSQLSRSLAFSQKSMTEGYTTSSTHGEFDNYNKCGFVTHLLLAFYSAHLKEEELFKVRPVLEINNYSDGVPKFSGESGKTTGWFLPGEAEWAEIKTNFKIVNASLSASGGTAFSTGQYFWSTEETGEKNVNVYKVVSGGLSTETKLKTETANTRAVLYL